MRGTKGEFVRCHTCEGSAVVPDDDGPGVFLPCRDCVGGQQPDPAVVEAVARVLIGGDEFAPPWDEALDPLKVWYRNQARAALLAYAREVTECRWANDDCDGCPCPSCVGGWQTDPAIVDDIAGETGFPYVEVKAVLLAYARKVGNQ